MIASPADATTIKTRLARRLRSGYGIVFVPSESLFGPGRVLRIGPDWATYDAEIILDRDDCRLLILEDAKLKDGVVLVSF